MENNSLLKNKFFILTIIVDVILLIVVFYLMTYVRFLLKEDARINLSEIVTQNKNVISSKVQLELNKLELDANILADRFALAGSDISDKEMKEIFLDYIAHKGDTSLIWAFADGEAVSGKGTELNIAARNYFRIGISGIPNISERVVSRLNGEDIFVISVPVYYNKKIVGTVQKQYPPTGMHDLMSASLFSDQGYSYIINSQGYILIFSRQDQYNRESDNYFRILYQTDPKASKRLERDIKNKDSGFMEAVIDGKDMFFAYTPIDKVYDWYLISGINKNAVSPNSRVILWMFYSVLLLVILLFSLSMFYYMFQKKRQRADLEYIAFVDTITFGDTYTKFMMDMRDIMKSPAEKKYCLCAFDIVNFKFINSFYGFEAGDRILRDLYWIYSKKINPNERIARVHSDHFVMILEDTSEKRIRELIEEEYHFGDIIIYISAGLYAITDRSESVNLMFDKANLASNKVKGVRYNYIEYYSDAFDKELTRNEQTKRAIEGALDAGEIIPYFQPKVDLYTREVVGAEALARWRKKDGTMISPGEFIPICEKCGLITLVDMMVFEKTLQFIKKNLDAGVKCLPISVNFSRVHLHDQTFIENFFRKFIDYGVSPSLIEVELTETLIFDNSDSINEFIDTLHAHGVKISMDDFGSGYSSLHMLKDINIDVLKIDRSFLLDTAYPERRKAVFGSVVEMAKKLDIQVVVEGVETEENLTLVKEFGCRIVQGYYFAKPMDAEAFGQIYVKGTI